MPTQATSGGHGAGFSPRSDGQLGDGIRVDGAQDALRDGAQLALLRLREWNEDEAADLRDMRGALATTLAQPSSVRRASVSRPSAGSAVRRTQPRCSSRPTTLDSRDSELAVYVASVLIRRVWVDAIDSAASTRYSNWLMPASRCICASIAAGRRISA